MMTTNTSTFNVCLINHVSGETLTFGRMIPYETLTFRRMIPYETLTFGRMIPYETLTFGRMIPYGTNIPPFTNWKFQ